MMNPRHGASIVIFLSIILLPYWIYLPLLLAAMIVFSLYFEALFFGFLIDILYGQGIESWSELFAPAAFSVAVILIILIPLRERLRFHI